ncbi:iron-molybdenum cofactor biosynthesis protein NifQ [Methylosinus sp. C49]|uniref:nitrogen fixation protein NifQ n=1 Tax=Methylosinus sp. C49 TaxID=2699395 RepID=UPI0013675F74|nr:nitrogen fixation protein NifQ [Methylosinus sp. C49]BBU61201.1 iron-molybdenum cofactor biosynthesis protein NifQ [Methylosinus sp. C49]
MAFLSEDRRAESGLPQPDRDVTDIYVRLRSRPSDFGRDDPFTAHMFCCVLALGLSEAAGRPGWLAQSLALGREDLTRLIERWAPEALSLLDLASEPEAIELDDEEDQIRELLLRFRGDSSDESAWLAAILAKRAMAPRHLWQDLGLAKRDELGRLMQARFPSLAARNVNHMKWKKFLYRSLCEMEGFVLCAAPTCRECSDFHDCFGDESGESALARLSHGKPSNS